MLPYVTEVEFPDMNKLRIRRRGDDLMSLPHSLGDAEGNDT
jgi:hypothetical protein